jgi:serine/threonine-protein kinase
VLKKVVLKLVKDGLDHRNMRRFLDEMRILAKLEHENIARMYDGGSDNGQLYIAMEYLRKGVNLREFMVDPVRRKQTALPLDQVVSVTKQVCEGLDAAHNKGIVHRDLKPENIVIISEGEGLRVKVIDFGIAISTNVTLTSATLLSARQLTSGIIGTPHYLSPEQAEGKTSGEIDHRSDVYSLGLVVYEMLTGERAFKGSLDALLRQHLENDSPPVSQLRPRLSAEVDRVVMRALRKDPNQRQQSVKELARELETAIERLEMKKEPAFNPQRVEGFNSLATQPLEMKKEPGSNPQQPAPALLSRRSLLLAAAAAIFLLVPLLAWLTYLTYKVTIDLRPLPTPTPSGGNPRTPEPKPTARETNEDDSAKLVGRWKGNMRSGFQIGFQIQMQITYQFNSDGTFHANTSYTGSPQTSVPMDGTWRYSDGVLYEQASFGVISAKSDIKWIDDNHFELTVRDHSYTVYRGWKGHFYKQP